MSKFKSDFNRTKCPYVTPALRSAIHASMYDVVVHRNYAVSSMPGEVTITSTLNNRPTVKSGPVVRAEIL